MAISSTWNQAMKRPLLVLLATAILLGAARSAQAQYRYVPSRDYYQNDTAGSTFLGGALGAISGAIIGGKKNRGGGALIGAGVGALTGNLLGRSKDRADQQQAAYGAATVARANHAAAAQAVTNLDLIRMTQARVSEDVIISAIRTRGTRLDLSPEGLIALKESGVSDRVLITAQDLMRRYAARPTTIVIPRPVRAHGYPPHNYYDHGYYHGPQVHYGFGY